MANSGGYVHSLGTPPGDTWQETIDGVTAAGLLAFNAIPVFAVGRAFDSEPDPDDYSAWQAYLSLDTGITELPLVATLTLPINVASSIVDATTDFMVFGVAAYNWATADETAWLDQAALNALTGVSYGVVSQDDLALDDPVLVVELPPSIINLAGTTKIIIFDVSQTGTVEPGIESNNRVFFDFAAAGVYVTGDDGIVETITESFGDWVFFDGVGGTSTEVPFPWEVSIDGRPFSIDLALYEWLIPDMLRQAIDTSARPGEQSFDTGGVWKRVFGDWSLGANQTYADTDRSSQRRFTESRGLDVWTERQVSMLPDTEVLADPDLEGEDQIKLLAFGAGIFYMGDTVVEFSDDITDETPTWAPVTAHSGNPLAFCTDGDTVYLSDDDGLWRVDTTTLIATAFGGAAATYSPTVLGYANGFLLGGLGNELVSIDAAGALTVLLEHDLTAFEWTAIAAAPNAIYVAGNAGNRSQIYRIVLNETTGVLGVPIHSGFVPDGETVHALQGYAGVLLIGTSEGLRLGVPNGNGELSTGPVIRTPEAVTCMAAEGEFVWFGWSNYDSTWTGVGRAKLSEFVDQLLPAHVSDLMWEGSGDCTAVVRVDGETYFAVLEAGIVRAAQSGALAPTGELRLGRCEFGTAERKNFIGVELLIEPLEGGAIHVHVEDDLDVHNALGSLSLQETTGAGEFFGGISTRSTYWDVELHFERDETDPTLGPVLRLVVQRSMPSPRQSEQWTVPIIATSKVNIGDGRGVERTQDVRAIRDFFRRLRRQGRAVIYQEGTEQHLVMVREVTIPRDGASKWATARDGLQGTVLVRLSSVRDV